MGRKILQVFPGTGSRGGNNLGTVGLGGHTPLAIPYRIVPSITSLYPALNLSLHIQFARE